MIRRHRRRVEVQLQHKASNSSDWWKPHFPTTGCKPNSDATYLL